MLLNMYTGALKMGRMPQNTLNTPRVNIGTIQHGNMNLRLISWFV